MEIWAKGSFWSRVRSFGRAAMGRTRVEEGMAEEMRFHMEERAADLERGGLSAAEARRRARVEFGWVEGHKDGVRQALGLRWLDELKADLRYAARMLRRSKGFTAVAVGSLALGIGANTMIFTVTKGVLLDRLAVERPRELRLFSIRMAEEGSPIHRFSGSFGPAPGWGTQTSSFSYPAYELLREQNRSHPVMEDLIAFREMGNRLTLTMDGHAGVASAELVSGNLYQQLGVTPQLGRAIRPSDDTPAAGLVAVISDGLWSRMFGRSTNVLGKTIGLNLIPVTIVGVNPPGFTGAGSVQSSPDVFLAFGAQPQVFPMRGSGLTGGPAESNSALGDKGFWWMQIVGRARAGVSDEQIRAAMAVWLDQDIRATLKIDKDTQMPKLVVRDGSRGMARAGENYAKPIYVLTGMTAFVLLLACANLANLLLARSAARQREMSVRLALGASRGRVLRQVMTESLLLSSLGGLAGLALGYFGRNLIPHLLSSSWQPTELNTAFDWRIFLFTAGVSVLTGVIFGLAPTWQATRAEVNAGLKSASAGATRRRSGLGGKAIVVFQIALSMVLVVGAGLFTRTLVNLNSAELGFDPNRMMLFAIQAPASRYAAPLDVRLHERLEERIARVPGVESVTLTEEPLLANSMSNTDFFPTDQPKPQGKAAYSDVNGVGRTFFTTYRIPIREGRGFTSTDTATSPRVAVINETLARRFYGDRNPVGRSFSNGTGPDDHTYQIVGVAADAKYDQLRDAPPATFYPMYAQQNEEQEMTYAVKVRAGAGDVMPGVRAAVAEIDKDLPLRDVRTQKEQIEATIVEERLFATLTAMFGVLALTLACIGIYGLMAYSVARRTNEIGVRMALGARSEQVLRMVLGESSWLAVAGLGLGLAGAVGLGRLVRSMLYGLEPHDWRTLAGSATVLLAVAVGAALGPARRASRIDPIQALRHE